MLTMWTIYQQPADFPTVPFVVRGWLTGPGGMTVPNGAVGFADTLDEARRQIPEGLYRIDRSPGDAPQIVETWV